ncbi:MAG: type II secretion system protein GspL [Burkholderiales bacterium]
MTELKIYVPESWSGKNDPCLWALANSAGPTARGENRFTEMPKADETSLIAPATRVLLLEAKLPKGKRKQLRQALPFAVEDKITADPETIHVAAGSTRTDGNTPLAVIDKYWLRRVLDALAEAEIFPRRMGVETLGPSLDPGSWTVVWHGQDGFARTGDVSGLALAANQSPPIELRLALREQPTPQQIVVRPTAELPDLARWSSELGVAVVRGRKWDWSETHDEHINLLQGEFAGGKAKNAIAKLRPVLILAGVIVTLQFALAAYDWLTLRSEAQRLTKEIEQTFKEAFPEAKTIVDAPLQMERNVTALRRGSGQAERGDFLPLLASAAQSVKTAGSLRSLKYEQGKLKLDVKLPQSQSAEELLQALQQTGMRVSLESVNSKDGAVEARYSIARGPL